MLRCCINPGPPTVEKALTMLRLMAPVPLETRATGACPVRGPASGSTGLRWVVRCPVCALIGSDLSHDGLSIETGPHDIDPLTQKRRRVCAVGMVRRISHQEQSMVVHKYTAISDGRIRILWKPVYLSEDGSRTIGAGLKEDTETITVKQVLYGTRHHRVPENVFSTLQRPEKFGTLENKRSRTFHESAVFDSSYLKRSC